MGNEESAPYIDDVNKRMIIKNSNSSGNYGPYRNCRSVSNSVQSSPGIRKSSDDAFSALGSSMNKKLSIGLLQKLPLFTPSGDNDKDPKEGSSSSGDVQLVDSPVTPPGPDLSQLSDAEKEHIAKVLARAKKIERDEDDRLRKAIPNSMLDLDESNIIEENDGKYYVHEGAGNQSDPEEDNVINNEGDNEMKSTGLILSL